MNQQGWGQTSTVSFVWMAAKPDKITPAAIVVNSGSSVSVTWTATPNDQGSPVTAYKISFKQSDGIYSETASCNGATVFPLLTCSVSMSVFTDQAGVYKLLEGSVIVAVVQALNVIDYSLPSNENTGTALA